MNLKKFFLVLTVATILILGLSSCATSTSVGSSGGSATSNLPSSYKLNLPDSLTKGSSAKSLSRGITRAGGTSYGFMQLQSTIAMMKQSSAMFGQIYLVVDVALTGLTPSTTTPNDNVTVTFTQKMIDNMMSIDPDMSSDMLPAVGSTFPMPSFYYATGDFSTLIDTTMDTTGYTNLVKFDMSSSSTETDVMYILWTSTMVKIVNEYKDPTYGENYKMDFSYDTTKKLSTMTMADQTTPSDVWLSSITMQEKNPDKSGIVLNMFDKFSSSGYKDEYYVSGYADDDGGYIETKVITEDMSMTGPGAKDVFKYKEQFDGNGNLTGAQWYDTTTGTWINDDAIGTWTDSSYDDEYYDASDDISDDPTSYDEYMNPDEEVITVGIPSLTFSSTEYEKDFAITAQGSSPTGPSGWDNVIGYFSVFDDEYSAGMTVDAYLWGEATNYDLHLITDQSMDQIVSTTVYSLTLNSSTNTYMPQ